VRSATDGSSAGGGASAWVTVALGVALLLLLAVANLRTYNDTSAPKVFDTIEGMGPGAVAFLAVGVTLVNPKNLALLLAAGETMRETSLSGVEMVVTVAVFTLVALASYLAVICYQLLGGEKAAVRLGTAKAALLRNNHKIMFWICLLIRRGDGGAGGILAPRVGPGCRTNDSAIERATVPAHRDGACAA
jgi:hypothetical protein